MDGSAATSQHRYVITGWVAIGVTIGGLVFWSINAPFHGAVIASGRLSVSTENSPIQHLEGGLIAELNVSEGDEVKAGDILIRIDDVEASAGRLAIDKQVEQLFAIEARLIAERDDADELTLRTAHLAQLDANRLRLAVSSQSALFQARQDSRAIQSSILRQNVTEHERRIQGLGADANAKGKQLQLLAEESDAVAILVRRGLAPKPTLLALNRAEAAIEGDAERLKSEIGVAKTKLSQARQELTAFSETERVTVMTELATVQAEIDTLLESRKAALERERRLEIRSPRAGYVLGLQATAVGEAIRGQTPVMYIVPKDDQIRAKVNVRPSDIDKISIGQDVRLRFRAVNQRQTPEVSGVVATIAADITYDEESRLPVYLVSIDLESQQPFGSDFILVPGMPVDAMLITRSRSALSYLIRPISDATAKAFKDD